MITEDWIDAEGNYYAESVVEPAGDGLFTANAAGLEVRRATALYTHSEDRIRIPRWKIAGQNAALAVLLHEMAHSAVDEPEVDHGPKWHKEMNRLWKLNAPINLHDVTPEYTKHELVTKHGIGSAFWESL